MRLLLVSLFLAMSCLADYRPDRDGASTRVGLTVVDVQGEPVSGAKVMFRVFTTFDHCNKIMRDTDSNGYCEIAGKTRGEITVVVTKDGYYTSYGDLSYRDLSWEDAVAEQKWTRGVVKNRVVMKAVGNPRRHLSGGMTFRRPPITNELLPFDAFVFDWCSPYGKGRVGDFKIGCYGLTNAAETVEWGLVIRADNCVDGFCAKTVDEWSKFRYALNADESAGYKKEIRHGLTLDDAGNMGRTNGKAKNLYYVFRIRSETNHVGKIIRSHYGIIDEGVGFQEGLSLGVQVNPTSNDTSLEDDWAYKHMIKGR